MTVEQKHNSRLIRLPEVKSMTGLGRSSIYTYMKEGKFPQSVQITERTIGWNETEIQDWITQRLNSKGGHDV